MDYSHVFEHPFNPRTVRVWDKLLLALDGEFIEAIYLDGPMTIIDDEHVVKVGNEIRLVNGQKLYQRPLCHIEDTAVYAGDKVRHLNGDELVLSAQAGPGVFVATLNGFSVLVAPEMLTVSESHTKKIGYIALSPTYGTSPYEVYAGVFAQRHVFKTEAEAQRTYPDAHIVEVSWYDADVKMTHIPAHYF